MSVLSRRDELELSETTIAVYGLGKMGLPLACVLADKGAKVQGVDIDEEVVKSVNSGTSPVENEPYLQTLVEQYGGGELEATTDGVEAARQAEVMIILVPTVVDDDFEPILGPVLEVAEDIRQGVEEGDLVILESTVPPGTTRNEIADSVEPEGLTAGKDFGVAHCPERTSSGTVIRDLTESYPKIVGGIDKESTRLAGSLYRAFNEPGVIKMSSATAAEAVKVFEGVYRDVNIALANELAKVCENWRLDASEIFRSANTQPYCNIHKPGIGVGGHCIPVYPYFVMNQVNETQLLETARKVNDSMPKHTVKLLEDLFKKKDVDISTANVLVLGATYRANVKETRYSPSVDAIETLLSKGTNVFVHDPLLTENELSSTGADPVSNPLEVPDLDGIILATGHDTYQDLDINAIHENMRTTVIVDGRRFFDEEELKGFMSATVGNLH